MTRDNDLKENAQKALLSYLRGYQLQKNKQVFQIKELPIAEYALSLGLASAPQISFGKKAAPKAAPVKAKTADKESDEESDEESDDDLLKVQRPDHDIDEADESDEELPEQPASKSSKKLKVDKYSGISKQSKATKVSRLTQQFATADT